MIVLPYFQNIAPTGRHWERRMPLGGSERFQNPFFPAPFPPIIYAPFQSHFRAIPEPFPSHSRAIPEPFPPPWYIDLEGGGAGIRALGSATSMEPPWARVAPPFLPSSPHPTPPELVASAVASAVAVSWVQPRCGGGLCCWTLPQLLMDHGPPPACHLTAARGPISARLRFSLWFQQPSFSLDSWIRVGFCCGVMSWIIMGSDVRDADSPSFSFLGFFWIDCLSSARWWLRFIGHDERWPFFFPKSRCRWIGKRPCLHWWPWHSDGHADDYSIAFQKTGKLENWKTGKLENWKMPSSNLESLMAEMFEKWNQSGYGRGSFHDHQMARVGRMANETWITHVPNPNDNDINCDNDISWWP